MSKNINKSVGYYTDDGDVLTIEISGKIHKIKIDKKVSRKLFMHRVMKHLGLKQLFRKKIKTGPSKPVSKARSRANRSNQRAQFQKEQNPNYAVPVAQQQQNTQIDNLKKEVDELRKKQEKQKQETGDWDKARKFQEEDNSQQKAEEAQFKEYNPKKPENKDDANRRNYMRGVFEGMKQQGINFTGRDYDNNYSKRGMKSESELEPEPPAPVNTHIDNKYDKKKSKREKFLEIDPNLSDKQLKFLEEGLSQATAINRQGVPPLENEPEDPEITRKKKRRSELNKLLNTDLPDHLADSLLESTEIGDKIVRDSINQDKEDEEDEKNAAEILRLKKKKLRDKGLYSGEGANANVTFGGNNKLAKAIEELTEYLKKPKRKTVPKAKKEAQQMAQQRAIEQQQRTLRLVKEQNPGYGVPNTGGSFIVGGFAKGTPLSNFQLDETASKMKNMEDYVGTFARDQLDQVIPRMMHMKIPVRKGRVGFILNMDPSTKPGSHWVGVLIDTEPSTKGSSSIEYYNPLADPWPEDIKGNLIKIAHQMNPAQPLKLKVNQIKDQSDTTNTCGIHSLKFINDRFNGKKFKEASGFESNVKNGEETTQKWGKKWDLI